MADFAVNYSPRYRLHYSSAGAQHAVTIRAPRSLGVGGLPSLISQFESFLGELAPVLYSDWTPVRAEFALADSDVFLPAPVPIVAPTFGAAEGPSAKAKSISFVGRSSLGHKARFFIYGIGFVPNAFGGLDLRIHSAENTPIALSIGVLNAPASLLAAADGQIVAWYSYVNLKYNDYWTSRVRRG